MLVLHATTAPAAPPNHTRVDTPIKLCFHVDDLDLARARLIKAGARMGHVRGFGAAAACDGVDPEGNVFRLQETAR